MVTLRALGVWLVHLVARIPASVHTKLLAAFLAIVALLLVLGAVSLQSLTAVNRHAEELRRLQLTDSAYRELQRDALAQNDGLTRVLTMMGDNTTGTDSSLPAPQREIVAFDALLHQANQFQEDFRHWRNAVDAVPAESGSGRLLAPSPEETAWLSQIRSRDDEFMNIVTRGVELMRRRSVSDARSYLRQATSLADDLESTTGKLVVLTDTRMAAKVEQNRAAYGRSYWVVIGFAAGSVGLALLLGYVISWTLIGPVRRINAQLKRIASGDFSSHVDVDNRDELAGLAANVNRTTEELDQLYQELAAASRHKSQFLANMSHELRTPLNAILGYTELILDEIYGEVPGKVREVLERVQKSGRHLLGLINDVLDLSKIEAGQLILSLDDYSLKDVVYNVSTAVESLAAEKHLHLAVAVPSNMPRGHGDERRITQVLLNLVGNAIKFTEAGEVAIRATVSDGHFLVAVSDTGPGIVEQEQQKIFEEFHQGDSSATRRKGGTGLGLSIAKRIVELHRGRLWVESSPGRGSTFWFSIPVLVEGHTS